MDSSAYAIIDAGGNVTNTCMWNSDPDTWQPPEGFTAVLIPDGVNVSIGWTYNGSGFVAPPPPPPVPLTPDEVLSLNTLQRNALLGQATSAIAPLQDAFDLGTIEPEEGALLTAWKTFRVAVNRVDLTQENPEWPAAPGELNYAVANPSA